MDQLEKKTALIVGAPSTIGLGLCQELLDGVAGHRHRAWQRNDALHAAADASDGAIEVEVLDMADQDPEPGRSLVIERTDCWR